MVYIITFLSSMLFGYWATRINPKTNRGLVFLCSLMSILIPSILAGVRDVSIGTDVEYYLLPEFNVALNVDDFKTYIALIWEKELGYMLLVFVIAKLFGNIQCLLFFFQFITMLCIYIGAWKFRKSTSLPFVLFLYFFVFYNSFYNLFRQSISMSIIFLALSWLFEKKYIKYFIAVLIATAFHTTAVIAIIPFFITWFLYGENFRENTRAKTLRGYILILVVIIGCIALPHLISFMVNVGWLHSRYLLYFSNDSVSNNMFDTVIYLIGILLIFMFSKQLKETDEKFEFFKVNLFFAFITNQLANVMYYGHRISLYFGIINILFVAKLPKVLKNTNSKLILSIGLIVLYAFYWIYIYVINGHSETYPYLSYWQT